MARRGDGIYQRGKTWWLDFTHEEKRHYVRLGRNISKTVAGEIAKVKRGAILKGEAGIGGAQSAPLLFYKAAQEIPAPAKGEKSPPGPRLLCPRIAPLQPPISPKTPSALKALH